MKKTILTTFAFIFISLAGFSQAPDYISEGALIDGKTIVKADLMGLTLRNYGFSAERIINKKLSVNLGVRFMPAGRIPMLSTINTYLGDPGADAGIDTESYLNDITINSFAFTPEFRIYPGRYGYGRGFYFAPYYNYFAFNLENFRVEEEIEGKMENAVLSGGIKTHSGGLMLGYQWQVGAKKNIVIDWGIIGVHAGTSSGNLDGTISRTLSTEDQTKLRNTLDENLSDVPLFEFTSKVDANTINVTEKGPWVFLRGSLSIGFRF